MLQFLKDWLEKKLNPFYINKKAQSIPEAFGYSIENYSKLVNDLTFYINDEERITLFESFINSTLFKQYKLNVRNPRHAAILGYAFCASVLLQVSKVKKGMIDQLFKNFYTGQEKDKMN